MPQIIEIPEPLIGENGWLDYRAMSEWVREALAATVGGVLSLSQGSLPVTVWTDHDGTAQPGWWEAGGVWRTRFVATPRPIREALAELADPPADLTDFGQRSLRVLYRTRRGRGARRPGKIDLELTACVRPRGADSAGKDVLPPKQLWTLCSDFLQRLGASS